MIFSRIKLIALIVLIALVAFFVWDYSRLRTENKRLNNELTAANATIDKLGKKMDAEMGITVKKDQIIKDIRNAPDSDDGPIAPVLRRTIERLQDNR